METGEKHESSSDLEERDSPNLDKAPNLEKRADSPNLEKGEHVVVQTNPQYACLLFTGLHICLVYCLVDSTLMSMTLTMSNDVSSNAMFKCKPNSSSEGTKLTILLRIAVGFPDIFFWPSPDSFV